MKIRTAGKKNKIIACLILIMLFLGPLCLYIAPFQVQYFKKILTWREKTSPLGPTVVEDLCRSFSISSTNKLCLPSKTVFAPDFFPIIKSTYDPKNSGDIRFDQVQKMIGKYMFKQEPPEDYPDGFTHFRCWYDLQGDRVYPFIIDYYGDGRISRIIADIGD